MAREFSVIIERDSEGYYYVASVPVLKGCHTQLNISTLCLEAQGDRIEPLDFIGVQKVTIAS